MLSERYDSSDQAGGEILLTLRSREIPPSKSTGVTRMDQKPVRSLKVYTSPSVPPVVPLSG